MPATQNCFDQRQHIGGGHVRRTFPMMTAGPRRHRVHGRWKYGIAVRFGYVIHATSGYGLAVIFESSPRLMHP